VNEANQPIRVGRILVSLDNSRHSLAALQAAVELAQHYGAELKAIFVEDTTLLRLAEMPFCQEVGEYTAIVREISSDGLSQGMVVQSRWVLRSFRNIINQTDLRAEIAIRRGNINETIATESQTCDLVIIGKTGTNPLGRPRLGSTAQALVKNHTKPLLLVEENNRLGYPMIVFYENSPLGKICLETARDLLNPEESLIILLSEDEPVAYTTNDAFLNQWAAENEVNISIQSIKTHTITRFINIIKGLKTGLLILPHDLKPQSILPLLTRLEQISLPILLIRKEN
jgi:nucleotide-binding universal stress UspA family protein